MRKTFTIRLSLLLFLFVIGGSVTGFAQESTPQYRHFQVILTDQNAPDTGPQTINWYVEGTTLSDAGGEPIATLGPKGFDTLLQRLEQLKNHPNVKTFTLEASKNKLHLAVKDLTQQDTQTLLRTSIQPNPESNR